MAQELSQAELLDFLCQAGGRVSNAALLGHFKRFLRDAAAAPEQLRERRERFKGFVNSVATVRQEAPGAAKFVVLRKRYRELVGEDAKPPAAAEAGEPPAPKPRPPPKPQGGWGQQQPQPQGRAGSELAAGAHGGACRSGERPRAPAREERPTTCRGAAAERGAGQRPRSCPPQEPGAALRARLPPPSPARSCRERPSERRALLPVEARGQRNAPVRLYLPPPAEPLRLRGGAPPAHGLCFLAGAPGAPPGDGSPQQRIREWLEAAHAGGTAPSSVAAPLPRRAEESWPGRPSPPSSSWSTCPSPSLDSQLGRPPADARPDRVPVFRSIRCQLFLQDLEDFVEQESPASEDGGSSSASGGSDSCRGEAGTGPPLPARPAKQNGHGRTGLRGARPPNEGPCHKPRAKWVGVPPVQKGVPPRNPAAPEGFLLLSQDAWGSSSSEEQLDKDPWPQGRPLRKVARLPPPPRDAPLSPQLVPRQGRLPGAPEAQGLGPDPNRPAEPRSYSTVPLESREHTWLVKVATGSWLQVRALLREDPHLAARKDFVSGYTVLHWLAKHGNDQVLQEVFTTVRKAGVALDVDAKSGCGYTPLHLAAIHGHQTVIKVLVQKLRCRVQVRDSSGKKPWQYLSSTTSGEVWQLLGAPRDKTIFPARPITRTASSASSLARSSKSPQLARKISRKASLAAYLKPQHIKWKMANKYPPLQEREECSD
ncbi:hypothetical protein lerEdw1_002387 [Lerista edwardsae]|nr:hypothetical protein lerEdw1_002387 [Lerista edwardsae]